MTGILLFMAWVIGVAWAILTFCIPFVLWAMLGHVKQIKLEQAKRLISIDNNLYACAKALEAGR